MNGSAFVDTTILVYVHDRGAGPRHERAKQVVRKLWETRKGVISTQVLQEFCVNAQKRIHPPATPEQLRAIVQTYLGWEVVVNSGDSVRQAIDLQTRYKISFWDALILNSAEEAGCDTLYSEDFSPGQHYGSVVVVNPFL